MEVRKHMQQRTKWQKKKQTQNTPNGCQQGFMISIEINVMGAIEENDLDSI